MATQTLTAMFDSYDKAAEAVRRLEAAGIPHADVSIVSNDTSHQKYYDNTDDATGSGTGTGTGASLGTLLGGGAGLLAGLGMLAIPGLGPVVAAGWLAATLVGAGVGAAAGGVVGALTDAGVSHEHAHVYAEGIRRGGTLVTARVDQSLAAQAGEILDRDGTIDMDERESTWRSEGWEGVGSGGLVGTTVASGVGSATAGLGSAFENDAGRTEPTVGASGGAGDRFPEAAPGFGPVTGLGTGGVRRTSGRVRVYDGL